MILHVLLRTFPQIFRPAARRLLIKSLLLTLIVFAGLGFGLFHALQILFQWQGWRLDGPAVATLTAIGTAAAAWLLFRGVAMAIMSLFADDIVSAVERESYPAAVAGARPLGFVCSLRFAMRSLARTVGWNLLALPFYVLLLATGVGTISLFLALNGYLLGRDLADMVEPRHPGLPPITGRARWTMGFISALLFLLPVVNLLAPIWSAAMAVHMLHGRRKDSA